MPNFGYVIPKKRECLLAAAEDGVRKVAADTGFWVRETKVSRELFSPTAGGAAALKAPLRERQARFYFPHS